MKFIEAVGEVVSILLPLLFRDDQPQFGLVRSQYRLGSVDEIVDGGPADALGAGDLGVRPVTLEMEAKRLTLVFGQKLRVRVEEIKQASPSFDVKCHYLTVYRRGAL